VSATKLEWVTWQPTPYNDYLFRSISADPSLDLTVHFVAPVLATHPWRSQLGTGFRSRIFKQRLGLDWHMLGMAVREKDRFFVVAGWQQTATIGLLNVLILLRRKFAIWTDTPDLAKRRPFPKSTVRSGFLRYLFRNATRVMGTGAPAVNALAQMGCPTEKLVNFPFVVDLDTFRPAPALPDKGSTGTRIVFLSSGRLSNALKGYDLAIKALALVRQRTGLDFRYRLAGDGPDKESLQALAGASGIEDRVEFTGWLEPSQLPDFYRSGQVFLHPSHFDPFPNAVLEAMASGLVVIGSELAGSVADRVVDGENGFVHRANDVEHLAAQIGRAVGSLDRLVVTGSNARKASECWPASRAVAAIKEFVVQAGEAR
jgi:glycosyltransferase involved in cell wall biosynthesis